MVLGSIKGSGHFGSPSQEASFYHMRTSRQACAASGPRNAGTGGCTRRFLFFLGDKSAPSSACGFCCAQQDALQAVSRLYTVGLIFSLVSMLCKKSCTILIKCCARRAAPIQIPPGKDIRKSRTIYRWTPSGTHIILCTRYVDLADHMQEIIGPGTG